jgi:hypothetical protein
LRIDGIHNQENSSTVKQSSLFLRIEKPGISLRVTLSGDRAKGSAPSLQPLSQTPQALPKEATSSTESPLQLELEPTA